MMLPSRKRPLATPQPGITTFSDCCGMDALRFALLSLGVAFRQIGACDISPQVKKFYAIHFGKEKGMAWYDDIFNRKLMPVEDLTLYCAGFPCQPFSRAGLNRGMVDGEGRGIIVLACIDAIRTLKPRGFILENVEGLLIQHPQELKAIIRQLRKGGHYTVFAKLLDVKA